MIEPTDEMAEAFGRAWDEADAAQGVMNCSEHNMGDCPYHQVPGARRRAGLAAVLALVERDRTAADYEYTQMCCDAWQMHHLANDWRWRYGWDAVAVTSLPAGYKVPKTAGDESGPEYEAVCPVAILFRRLVGWTSPS